MTLRARASGVAFTIGLLLQSHSLSKVKGVGLDIRPRDLTRELTSALSRDHKDRLARFLEKKGW
jgi:hypothetical protein